MGVPAGQGDCTNKPCPKTPAASAVPLTPLARYGISLSGAALAAGGGSGQGDCFAYDQFPAFQQPTSPAKIPRIRNPLHPWDLLVQLSSGATRPDFRYFRIA